MQPSETTREPRTADKWTRWLPGLRMAQAYEIGWLRNDLVAGIVLSTMLIPVGMAYAVASGLPAINGLYATIVPLVAYAVFGPSRILVLGPDSSLAPMILAVVLPLSGGDAARGIAIGAAMALVAGAVCIAAGVARLGFVTELLSRPIRYGYMNGIALAVLVSQLPKLLGFKIESTGPLRDLWASGQAVIAGQANWAGTILGLATLALILLLKAHKRIGAILAAVIGATLATVWLDLPQRFGVNVLGQVPQGLPDFAIPWLNSDDLVPIATGGLAVALVAFADTSVLSRAFAARTGTRVDPNQEMVGLGFANVAAGLFQGFPISSSSSRTPIAEAAGAKTQMTGLIGAAIVAVVILGAPSAFKDLPYSALAAVVIASALGLFEITELARIYRIQNWEFWLSIVCTAGVAVFGAIQGIGIAIVVAVIEFLWDGWRPHSAVLADPEGIEGFHDIARHPDARRIPGLVLFRWDAPLFFANAEYFSDKVMAAVRASPSPVRRVVVAAEPITSIDVTSADALCDLDSALKADGIDLYFAEMKDPVKDKLKRFGLFARFGEKRFLPTVESAVRDYRRNPGG